MCDLRSVPKLEKHTPEKVVYPREVVSPGSKHRLLVCKLLSGIYMLIAQLSPLLVFIYLGIQG